MICVFIILPYTTADADKKCEYIASHRITNKFVSEKINKMSWCKYRRDTPLTAFPTKKSMQ